MTHYLPRSTSGMMFGRPIPSQFSSADDLLISISNNGSSSDKAIIENLRIDTRVSESRAESFLQLICIQGLGPQEALNLYSSTKAARDFQTTSTNESNLAKCPPPTSQELLPINTEFVSLMVIWPTLRSEIKTALKPLMELDEPLAEAEFVQLLERVVEQDANLPVSRLPDAIEIAHQQLLHNVRGANDRFVWVGLSSEFEPLLQRYASDPARLLEVFGLGHLLVESASNSEILPPKFILVLKYSIDEVTTVARPSVLEAGLNPWHFPTCVSIVARDGGRTVILGLAFTAGVQPLREYIHNYRAIRKSDVIGILKFVPEPACNIDVAAARANHLKWTCLRNVI